MGLRPKPPLKGRLVADCPDDMWALPQTPLKEAQDAVPIGLQL